jgi:diaminopimelate epimerase
MQQPARDYRCWKVYAEGNSYIVTDDGEVARRLGGWVNDLHSGFGGDGLIQVDWVAPLSATLQLTNRDGSTAGLCVNGARCVTALGALLGTLDLRSPVDIEAESGTVRQIADPDRPHWFRGQVLSTKDARVEWDSPDVVQVDIGVPHRVVFSKTAGTGEETPPEEHACAVPGGTNVMLTHVPEPGTLVIRPWERGVGPVGGCASGAAAAVLAYERLFGSTVDQYDIRQPRGRLTARVRDGVVELAGTAHVLAQIRGHRPPLWGDDD